MLHKFVYNFVTMIASTNIRTVTDMRRDANGLLSLASRLKQPIGILKNNKIRAYLLDPETLEGLENLVEDYLDYQMVAERVSGKDKDFLDLEGFWQKKKLPR